MAASIKKHECISQYYSYFNLLNKYAVCTTLKIQLYDVFKTRMEFVYFR